MRLFFGVRDRVTKEVEKSKKVDVEAYRERRRHWSDDEVKKWVRQKARELGVSPGPLYRAVAAALYRGEDLESLIEQAAKLAKEKGKSAADYWLETYAAGQPI